MSTPPANHPWRATAWAVLPFCLLAILACGKKGPPLAPLIRLPAAPDGFSARRLGATVYVQLVIPSKNRDNSTPADISRVDVYGFTGTPASDEEIVKYGTLVATLPVRRPPTPEEEDRARTDDRARSKERKPARAQRPAKAREQEPGFDQGATVTVTEALTAALLQPVVAPGRTRKKPAVAGTGPILLPGVAATPLPSRVYAAVALNRKHQRGVFTRHVAIPVLDAPAAPRDLKVSHTETAITVDWSPPPGVSVPLARSGKAAVLPFTRIVSLGGPAWAFQVYEVPAPDRQPATVRASSAPAAPAAPVPLELPVPLNEKPLAATTFSDAKMEFGTERCYVVRTLESFGALQEESEPSPPVCITPRDIYPPAAPKGLTAVVNAGAINLIWDPNGESDLDGYLVLRGDAPDGTLQPITREPIRETTFNDTGIRPGVAYVYAVVAVDKAGNRSAQSTRVQETAR